MNPLCRFSRVFLLLILAGSILLPETEIYGQTGRKVKKAAYGAPKFDASMRLASFEKQQAMNDSSLFKNLPWQFIGPTNISGRMTDVAVVPHKGKNYTIYVATASGGVWKTVNEGTTWKPVFQQAASTSIGDIALDPNNENTLWVGTGEANIFRSSNAGTGVYRTRDGGKTWENMGLANTSTLSRILVSPTDSNVVYVAASGCEWANNPDRGVYKTTDGGKNWQKVLFIDDKTGAIDLVMDPSNPDVLYAATWQRIRKKWNDPRNENGYDGSGIYRTRDGGKTWVAIDNGLPSARYRGRIGIDLARSDPKVLYAFVDNYEVYNPNEKVTGKDAYGRPESKTIKGATVFRSDDYGDHWRQVSDTGKYMRNLGGTYGWVFGQVRVDPNNENRIFVMGLSLNISGDGGKTFTEARGIHADHHGLWIDPENSNYLVNVNDGGLAISYDGGKNFRTFADNIPVAQHFTVSCDMASPFHVYTSIQDHGSFRGAVSLAGGRNHIPAVAFERAPGWEGNHHAIDPTDPDIVYSAEFYGSLAKTDLKTSERKDIMPRAGKNEPPYRAQWLAPFIISPHNPRILYYGNNFLFRSLNMGDEWEKLSPDLTYNDSLKSGDIPYQTLFTISESPLQFGLIYAGTDDGRLHATRDYGMNWTEITSGLVPGRWISRVVASAYDKGTVYVAQNGKRDEDFRAYLWKSTDYGKTWHDITANIPCGPVNVIQEDPKSRYILYVGTDWGVYLSINGGNSWMSLPGNMPTAYVHDLVIHPRDNIMIAATHGRGMYAMDVTYIQSLDSAMITKPVALYALYNGKVSKKDKEYGRWAIEDISLPFFLKQTGEYTLTISDSTGRAVHEIRKTGEAGFNISEWDLTLEKEHPGEKAKEEEKEVVEPGLYTVTLKTSSGKDVKSVEITEDPSAEESPAARMRERD